MDLLVVQEHRDLGQMWCSFLERRGFNPYLACTYEEAIDLTALHPIDALIVDPALPDGGIAIADIATYRNPDLKILVVTRSSFFSESILFDLIPNARGILRPPVRPEDIAAYIEHFKGTRRDAKTPRLKLA